MDVRKMVSLPADLARQVENFRFEERLKTEAEAIRRLIELGLNAERRSAERHPVEEQRR